MDTSPDHLRIGDRERDQTAERLAAHAAAGRLTVDELERRLERTQLAVFARDLRAVQADLPDPAPARGRRGAPSVAIVALLGAVAIAVAVGHPIPPLFVAAALLWRRAARHRLGPARTQLGPGR
jgi:Domain of unknown function (DUF1707)